jgi:hypothetical protein
MPSGPQPDRAANREALNSAAASESSPSNDVSADMLSEIVAETAASLARPEVIDPALRATLVEVARQFSGQPMTLDPTGTALLSAVLRERFAVLATRPELLSRTARAVAGSLLADPAARLRVEHLWATLAEEVG